MDKLKNPFTHNDSIVRRFRYFDFVGTKLSPSVTQNQMMMMPFSSFKLAWGRGGGGFRVGVTYLRNPQRKL
jgi:hypothetical protein